MRFAAAVGLLLVGRVGSREAAPPTDAFAYRACSSPMQAYAAAWFARVDAFLTTSFLNSPRMEAHDTAMFTADSGRGGAPRVALKPDRLHDFYVDHLSGRESPRTPKKTEMAPKHGNTITRSHDNTTS